MHLFWFKQGHLPKILNLASPRAEVVFILLSVFLVISFSNITVLLQSCMFIFVL